MITRFLSGSFDEESTVKTAEDGKSLDKKAMLVYCGKFNSLDGEVEIKDTDIDTLAANYNSLVAKLGRLASGDVPLKHAPPIQLDHSTSAKDTVGRLIGPLEIGEHKLEDGTAVKALFGTVRVLGKENVEKVADGRWTHLSIGADLADHKISELTITPFPAAADASLLSRPQRAIVEYRGKGFKVIYQAPQGYYVVWADGYKEGPYDNIDEVKEHLRNSEVDEWNKLSEKEENKNLSEGDTMDYKSMKEKMEMYAKCKQHLMDEQKLSDEDAEKKLGEMKDEELSQMASDQDAKMKKLADEDEAKKKLAEDAKAEMSKHSGELKKLAAQMKDTQSKVQLAAKKGKLSVRLARLKADAKITPAELKKLSIDDLVKKSDEAVEAVLESFEKREPSLSVGLYGSVRAMTASQMHNSLKKLRMSKLELETMLNMPSKRDEALKRLAALQEEEKEINVHIDNVPQGSHPTEMEGFDLAYDEMKKLMDEGKIDDAKEKMKSYMAGLMKTDKDTEVGMGEAEKEMSELAEEVKKMQTGFVDFVKLTAKSFGLEPSDLV